MKVATGADVNCHRIDLAVGLERRRSHFGPSCLLLENLFVYQLVQSRKSAAVFSADLRCLHRSVDLSSACSLHVGARDRSSIHRCHLVRDMMISATAQGGTDE